MQVKENLLESCAWIDIQKKSKGRFIRRMAMASNAIQTIDNEASHLHSTGSARLSSARRRPIIMQFTGCHQPVQRFY